MQTIYTDAQRTIARDGDELTIRNKRGEQRLKLDWLSIGDTLKADQKTALRHAGYDPAGWYTLDVVEHWQGIAGNATFTLCPPETRSAVEATLKGYRAEIDAARREEERLHAEFRNRPENAERRRIDAMFAAAERRIDYPGEYYPMLLDAENALEAWRANYPEAAKKERIGELLGKAAEQDGLASGALVYDADGSLTYEMQQERAAAFRAKAAAFRAEAARLQED